MSIVESAENLEVLQKRVLKKGLLGFRQNCSNDEELKSKLEKLKIKKKKLQNSIQLSRDHKDLCDKMRNHLTALLQKKIEEINSRQSDYRGRLEDYHHVRCQVTDFTSRGYNINEQVARIKQENAMSKETLEAKRDRYNATQQRLIRQLDEDQQMMRESRDDLQQKRANMNDEMTLVEARLRSAQVQMTSLEADYVSKSEQCEEMRKLCDELIFTAENNQPN